MPVETRLALFSDLDMISEIYNQGIIDRVATFEADHKTREDISPWLKSGYPVVVAADNHKVVAFGASFPYSSRACYRGIGEFSVYVERTRRGSGLGFLTMSSLITEAEKAGLWKLVSRVFVENTSSRILLKKLGFREVGIYEKHGKLDGKWKDVVIVELLIERNLY